MVWTELRGLNRGLAFLVSWPGARARRTGAQERGEARTEPPAAGEDRPGAGSQEPGAGAEPAEAELRRRRRSGGGGGGARLGEAPGRSSSQSGVGAGVPCGHHAEAAAGVGAGGWRLEAR